MPIQKRELEKLKLIVKKSASDDAKKKDLEKKKYFRTIYKEAEKFLKD